MLIAAGSEKMFLIRAEIVEVTREAIFGHFAFYFEGIECGNWNDSVYLSGCYSWLKDFYESSVNRMESELLDCSAFHVQERLMEPIFSDRFKSDEPDSNIDEFYEDTYRRFHIAHIGMSAFDKIIMVLIEDESRQRCVWKWLQDTSIHDYYFESRHMQSVAKEFCSKFERGVQNA